MEPKQAAVLAIFGTMVFTCGLIADQFGLTFDAPSVAAGTAIAAVGLILLEWQK